MAENDDKTAVIEPSAPVESSAPRLADDPKIVSAVSKHLDAFNETFETEDTPDETPPAEETPSEDTPAETPEPEGEPTPEGKDGEDGKETDGEPVPKASEEAVAGSKSASTLPGAYVRTAKARGWTDDEIVQFHEANPALAIKTFERMHESRTKEINEWAELGRRARGAAQPSAASSAAPAAASFPAPVTPQTPGSVVLPQPLDPRALAEKFGNQELIEAIVGPVNATIAALTPLVKGAQEAQKQAEATQKETLTKVVTDFFFGEDMKPYADLYGANLTALTPKQIKAQNKVLELADALVGGATLQGRTLPIQEALLLAHDALASDHKTTVIRDKIRKDVQKRAKGLTLRPTGPGRRDPNAPPRDRQELISRTSERLAAAFSR